MPGCKRAQRPYGVLAQVVQKVDNAIHRKNLGPLDGGIPPSPPPPGATVLSNAYLLDSNLSLTAVDSAIHLLNKLGLEL